MKEHPHYREHTERLWFVLDGRGGYHKAASEADARETVEGNPDVFAAFWRDVTYGPMVEVGR